MFERSRSLQIYVKPGIKEDDVLIGVWEAAKKMDRPQDIFRSMLRAGLMAMLESGELPESIIDECHLDSILEKRLRRKSKKTMHETPVYAPPSGHHTQQWTHPHPQAPIYAPVMPPQPQPQHYIAPISQEPIRQNYEQHIPEPKQEYVAPVQKQADIEPQKQNIEAADKSKEAPKSNGSSSARLKNLM